MGDRKEYTDRKPYGGQRKPYGGQRKSFTQRKDYQQQGGNYNNGGERSSAERQRESGIKDSSIEKADLEKLLLADLKEMAKSMNITEITGLRKADLIEAILKRKAEDEGLFQRTGVLDILSEGYGFMRVSGYLPSEGDIYVSQSQIRRFHLRRGDQVAGQVRAPKDSEKYNALLRIETVNGDDPEVCRTRRVFEQLTPLYPQDRLRLETTAGETAPRIIDLVAPIGKGQRGLIVSPPRAGKTTILKSFANSITTNNPEVYLIVLLVDERPEEVTDMERSVKGEVVSSTFDMPSENHIQVAELVLERAKRLVEHKKDVVVLLDSVTRLARAYNLTTPTSGRILSGGVDSTALFPPKRFFGAARKIEEGGSITIIATALVDTGSRMDEVIFEEFKGTGNMELHLDRKLADKRIFPAIDIEKSGTRKEELLMEPPEAQVVWKLRRVLHSLDPNAAIELLIEKVRNTGSNGQFLIEIQKSPIA